MPSKKSSNSGKRASTSKAKAAKKASIRRGVAKKVARADQVPAAPIENPSNVAGVAQPIAVENRAPSDQPTINPEGPVARPSGEAA